jgi:hypothetical protein
MSVRPICKIINGKYNGRIVSVTDDTPAPDDIRIGEFKILKLATDSKATTDTRYDEKETEKYREILYITGASWIW